MMVNMEFFIIVMNLIMIMVIVMLQEMMVVKSIFVQKWVVQPTGLEMGGVMTADPAPHSPCVIWEPTAPTAARVAGKAPDVATPACGLSMGTVMMAGPGTITACVVWGRIVPTVGRANLSPPRPRRTAVTVVLYG